MKVPSRDEKGQFQVEYQCTQCEMLSICGVPCHETGCPLAWQDEKRECKECGSEFKPKERADKCCSPCCYASYTGSQCECENCQAIQREAESGEGPDDYEPFCED